MKLRSLLAAALASLLLVGAVAFAQQSGQAPGVNSNLSSFWTLVWEASTLKPTYSATQSLTPASSATDVCVLKGSATKLVRLRRVIFTGLTTSTVATNLVTVLKRSTADSDGTAIASTITPYDSSSGAATATFAAYTANPTTGTLVGYLIDLSYTFALTTSVVVPTLSIDFGRYGSAAVLHGVAESVAFNLGAVTVAGPVTCTFEWTEE